jgi:hypothetical protein
MPSIWFLILEHIRFDCIALHWFLPDIFFVLQSRNHHCFIPIVFSCCLEKLLQVLFGDDRKSTSGSYFSILVILNLSPWGRVKKLLEKMQIEFYFYLIAFQILYVFLPDISILCALINYAYIWLRVYAWYLLSFHMHLNAR